MQIFMVIAVSLLLAYVAFCLTIGFVLPLIILVVKLFLCLLAVFVIVKVIKKRGL